MEGEDSIQSRGSLSATDKPSPERRDLLLTLILGGLLILGLLDGIDGAAKGVANIIIKWRHPPDVAADNEAARKSWIKYCNALVTEGVEFQTRWNDVFGCSAKHGDTWERLNGDYYQPRPDKPSER